MEPSTFNAKIHEDADRALERLRVHRLRPDVAIANERARRVATEALCLRHRATWSWSIHGAAAVLAALWLWRSPWGTEPLGPAQWLLLGVVGGAAYLAALALWVPSTASLRAPLQQFDNDAQPISLAQLEQLHADIDKIPALRAVVADWLESGHPLRAGDIRLIAQALPALRGREVLLLLQRHSITGAPAAIAS